MKKLTTIVLLTLIVWNVKAQTGVTSYPIPTAYNGSKTCIKIDAAGNKWFGTTSRGLIKFDGTNFTQIDTLTPGFPSEWVNDVAFYTANNIFVATNKGLARYTGSTWVTYNTGNSNIPNDTVNCIAIQGPYIYVGTNNGVGKFNLTTWVNYNSINSGLTTRKINCLAVDNVNDLYVGTNVGLYKLAGSVWTDFATVSAYYTSIITIKSLYIDTNNDVWVSGQNGGYKLSGTTLIPFYSLYFNTGLPSLLPNSPIVKGPNGGVVFIGGTGLVEIVNGGIYYYSGITIGIYKYIANDNTTNFIWGFGNNTLFSFNHTTYTGNTNVRGNSSVASLDVNQVSAEILNRGDMFWDVYGDNTAKYEVPKYSGRSANFASALWIGGIDNGGQLHLAAQTYRQVNVTDYWPGPVDTVSGTADSATSASFDRLWKLDKININEFRHQFALGNVQNHTYAVDSNIITYPAVGTGNFSRNLAPFVDVNHDGLYRPLIDGDYPKIKGDQEVYWIFNDVLAAHSESGGLPLAVEIHGTAYAFACPNITDSLDVLNYTTFYNYKIYNRGTNNYHNTHIGYWDDVDLGWYKDDFVGCNPSMNYGMGYNGDNVDGPGGRCYGAKPPMISPVILNGPLAQPGDGIDNNNNGVIDEVGEKNLMTGFVYTANGTNVGNQTFTEQYFNTMCGLFSDSTTITYGGTGVGGITPTRFMLSGALDDTTMWSEAALHNVPDDRRFVMGCGPFNLNAGQSVEFDIAQVFTRDTISAYTIGNLYEKNKADVRRVQQWFAVDSFPSCLDLYAGVANIQYPTSEIKIYPNPSSGVFTITSKNKITKIEVFNLLGEVMISITPDTNQSTININQYSKSIYFVQITDGSASSPTGRVTNKKIIIQ